MDVTRNQRDSDGEKTMVDLEGSGFCGIGGDNVGGSGGEVTVKSKWGNDQWQSDTEIVKKWLVEFKKRVGTGWERFISIFFVERDNTL